MPDSRGFESRVIKPEALAWLRTLGPDDEVALVTNCGGVGLRLWMEQGQGWGEPAKYPTEMEATNRVHDIAQEVLSVAQHVQVVASFFAFRFQNKRGTWGPIPDDVTVQSTPQWSDAWRLPMPGMIYAALDANMGKTAADTVFVGSWPNERRAAEEARVQFADSVALFAEASAEEEQVPSGPAEFGGDEPDMPDTTIVVSGNGSLGNGNGNGGPKSQIRQLVDEAEVYHRLSDDRRALPGELTMNQQGEIEHRGTAFEPTDWALAQVAGRLAIPPQYLKRCPSELQATNVNHWLAQQDWDKRYLLRGYDGGLRAFMSNQYKPISNHSVLEAVANTLEASDYDGEARIVRPFVGADALFLRVIVAAKHLPNNPDGNYGVGFFVKNGEIGNYKAEVAAIVQRNSCDNSIISAIGGWSHQHRWVSEAWLRATIAEKIALALPIAAKTVDQIVEAEAVNIPKLSDVITKLVKQQNLSEDVEHQIRVGTEKANTRMGLVNGLSYAAHATDGITPDEATTLEELSGKVLAAKLFGSVGERRVAVPVR